MRANQMPKLKKAPNWWKDKADPVPVEIPVDMKQPETMDDKIKRIIQEQISPQAANMGEETLEESQDYEVGDDFEGDAPQTMYEETEMVSEYLEEAPEEKVETEQIPKSAKSDEPEKINSVEEREKQTQATIAEYQEKIDKLLEKDQ